MCDADDVVEEVVLDVLPAAIGNSEPNTVDGTMVVEWVVVVIGRLLLAVEEVYAKDEVRMGLCAGS